MRNEFLRKFLATQLFTNLITLGEFSFSKMTLNLKMILAGHIQPKRIMQFLRIKNSRIIFFYIEKNTTKILPSKKHLYNYLKDPSSDAFIISRI